jgi:hypothetical protein
VPAAAARATARQASIGVSLSDAELTPLTGRFFSSGLNAGYDLSKGTGTLLLRRARTLDTLRAVDPRTFRGGGVTLHFADDPKSSPAFTVENGRARGIEFERIPAASGAK